MGRKARRARDETKRTIRLTPLSDDERALLATARYEGSPQHKKEPNDFGLIPPTSPRPDKTLCDEAGVLSKAAALPLFQKGVSRGLVSAATTGNGYPKQIWVVDGEFVYELMYGGSQAGCYHGYPIRRNDPLYGEVRAAWETP